MSRRLKIYLLCFSFLLGVAGTSWQRFEYAFLLAGGVLIICAIVIQEYFWASVFCVFVLGCACCIFSVYQQRGSLALYEGKEIVLQGEIVIMPKREASPEVTFKVESVVRYGHLEKVFGGLRIKSPYLKNMEIGDKVEVEGIFSQPKAESVTFYFSKGLAGDFALKKAKKIGISQTAQPNKYLARFNNFGLQKINATFPDPANKMLAGLLLGARADIPKEIQDAFRATGTTHILAISGYNITIIFSSIEILLARFLKPRARYVTATVFIIAFVSLVGLSSSVVRAAVMGIITGFSRRTGRGGSSFAILVLACTLMVIANPKTLIFDVGFQLSALATFGIMAFEKSVEEKIHFVPNFLQLREILSTTIAAQIPVIPILVNTFQSLSTLTLVANLVLPLVPLIMASGFFVVLISFVCMPVARLFAVVPTFLVNTMDSFLIFLSKWNFALLDLHIPGILLILYSLGVIVLFIYLQRKPSWN